MSNKGGNEKRRDKGFAGAGVPWRESVAAFVQDSALTSLHVLSRRHLLGRLVSPWQKQGHFIGEHSETSFECASGELD